jgi:hypothetical protein
MASIYSAYSAALPTTAAPVKLATGTAIKTLMQVAIPAGENIRIVEWGISLDTPASASIVAAELVQTDVAATTGTSFTPIGVNADGLTNASACVGGTALTCFGPSVEGTTTATRIVDVQLLVPPFVFVKQWPLGRECSIPASKFVRVRVTASVTCNAYAYVIWEE